MCNYSLLSELFLEVDEAIRRIERRFVGINTSDDFVHDDIHDDNGLDRLDGICMMPIAISENIIAVFSRIRGNKILERSTVQDCNTPHSCDYRYKRIDKIAGQDLFAQFPEIDWSGIKGIRNILAHDYFNIDAEEIYKICSSDLPILKRSLENIRRQISDFR
jgi:hypothetical protein